MNKMMAVSVTLDGASLRLGTPTPLFAMRAPGATGAIEAYSGSSHSGPGFDTLPDGRFVAVRATLTPAREIVLVQHWFEELKRLVPTP